MEIYLDNSATTKAYKEVKEVVSKMLCEDYGNPSSMHRKGFVAEQAIKEAKTRISKFLKVQEKELLFTSGGTESDNLAIIGTARAHARKGKHLITTCIEHSAVLESMRFLEEYEGFEVTYLPVDANGIVDLVALQEALRPETIVVSIMYLNNEVGALQPLEEATKLVKSYSKDIIFHSDAVQAFGKYRIFPKRIGIDLLSLSSHKIHGPMGVGLLYMKDGVKLLPTMYGGGQQGNLRSGTEDVPGIVGFGLATELIYQNMDEKVKRIRTLKRQFIDGLQDIEEIKVHGYTALESAPHIINVGFAGIRSEVLLHALEEKEIYVSAGSACASNHPAISGVLQSMKVPEQYLESSLRFSFSEFTTQEEINIALQALHDMVPIYRKYKRG